VQFVIGKKFYLNAYKALKRGSANMDVLVALGTSCAYFYSVGMLAMNMLAAANSLQPSAMVAHQNTISEVSREDMMMATQTYFDTSAMLISFILLGKYFEVLAKGKTSEAIRELMSLQVYIKKAAVHVLGRRTQMYNIIVGHKSIVVDIG
jgi:Cu+-exporting ATPase